MTRMSGAMAILQSLMGHGVDTIFGLPGGQLDHFFDAMYKEGDKVRFIGTRHEQGAAYMAFGYARSTGRPSVYTVVPGPGLLNTTAAICTAYACNSPVMCLTGQIPSTSIGKGIGELHELPDQLATMKTLTKWAARIDHPAQAPALVAEAFAQMTNGRQRPVELEMAMDIMGMDSDVTAFAPYAPAPLLPDPDAILEAVKLIGKAKYPMIYVGGGALDASPQVQLLAEMLGAPVVSFRSGRGVVSDDHPLGFTLPAGHRIWPKVDLVIGIGSRMVEPLLHWGTDSNLKVLRIDTDPVEITRFHRPDVAILSDATLALAALLPVLDRTLGKPADRADEFAAVKASVLADIQKVQPQMSYLNVLREELPRDGIFCDEITQCGFTSWYGFPVYEPRQHINCSYQGTLGYGFATALGVKVAHPDKPVISIAGDGGFMFTMQELATAVQYNIGLKTIIFNSNSFTNVQRQQREWFGNRIIGSDLHNPDFVKMAESFGAAGYRAETPEELRAVIRRALAEPGPAIIEVPVPNTMATPWEFIMMPQNRGVTA
ncbi:thiamine pyrophosphate-dependent enzyme [Govanella unica]|uniref:Thiamine pyrophosphate-binding protein n=1 Tax=Govanella unica TaxID=2975056 RepID=A0A9X3TVB0_9PROT|nr:thiamine pyrophosphate-dependent enzyme [Govania unica]MDA5192695.1 thiamine pyrophosphate-binding protein [Govania unica]